MNITYLYMPAYVATTTQEELNICLQRLYEWTVYLEIVDGENLALPFEYHLCKILES